VLRVTRHGSRVARDTHASLLYVARGGIGGVTRPLFEGPRSAPVTWASTLEAQVVGDTLELSVPMHQRSVRDEHLRELQVDGLTFVFDSQGLEAADATGLVSISRHEADGSRLDIDSDDLRRLDVTLDGSTVPSLRFVVPALPTLSPEANDVWRDAPTEIEDPFVALGAPVAHVALGSDRMPQLVVRPDAELGLAFTLEPQEHGSDCLRALLVLRESVDAALSHLRTARDAPSQLVDRRAWDALVAADITQRGFAGGTPTLALDPVGRSVWFHAPPGEDPQAADLALVVGCLEADRSRVGLLGIEVRGRR
jgi:hypothetical protein